MLEEFEFVSSSEFFSHSAYVITLQEMRDIDDPLEKSRRLRAMSQELRQQAITLKNEAKTLRLKRSS